MSNKIPEKHLKNLAKIRLIIKNFDTHLNSVIDIYNACSEYCLLFEKLPRYLQDKSYLREFYNQAESYISSIKFHTLQLSEISNKYIEFDNRLQEFKKGL